MFCSIGLIANVYSVYQPYIIKENHFSYTQGSFLVTLRMTAALISLAFIDKYYRILGIRIGATLAISSIGVAYILYGLADFYFSYALASFVSGIGYSLGAMVPVSIIIKRWFKSHLALSIGLCSAGTGFATVIMPSIITQIIEKSNLRTMFFTVAGLIFIMAFLIWKLIRNNPHEIGLEPLCEESRIKDRKQEREQTEVHIGKRDYIVMLFMLFLLGGGGSNGFTHLGVLYSSEGYSSMEVASIISIAGFLLILGKCTYGALNDKLGTYKSNFVFCTLLALGFLFCCLSTFHNPIILFFALLTLGFGFPTNNMGVPIWSKDLSNERNYDTTIKHFQLCYTLGTLVFSILVGVSADHFQSYIPAYAFFTVIATAFLIVIQITYKKYLGVRK